MEFTGERIVPGRTAEVLFREHEVRYIFAGQYVVGKDVLDIACGTGVGTSFMRRVGARSAWGLDIDPHAIAYAKQRYPECRFAQSEATNLCLSDSSIDVVVSFETLEHIKDQRRFLIECRRVLSPGGLLICSTPNKNVYQWQVKNPFHVHELAVREFADLLTTQFGELRLFSQAERIIPLYLLRRLASRALDRTTLKAPIMNILGWSVPYGKMRDEFSAQDGGVTSEIQPYRELWFRQPTYLIATARKISN